MEVTVSNSSISQKEKVPLHSMKRHSTSASGTTPEWNDTVEIRCCLGWDIDISIHVQDSKVSHQDIPFHRKHNHTDIEKNCPRLNQHKNHNKNVLYVDKMFTGTCTNGQYYLRKDGKVCGDINLTLEYFPNHQSLKCLFEEVVVNGSNAEGANRDTSVLMLLLGELVGMIRQSVK